MNQCDNKKQNPILGLCNAAHPESDIALVFALDAKALVPPAPKEKSQYQTFLGDHGAKAQATDKVSVMVLAILGV